MKKARFTGTIRWNSKKLKAPGVAGCWLLAGGRSRVGQLTTNNYLRAILAFLLPVLFPLVLFGQAPLSDSFSLLHTLPLEAKYFAVDKLRQVYLVTSANEVVKYSQEGKELFRYNNNTRGNLSYIDATDPFNLLLFYPELQAIATLDRTMNETALLLLFSADIINATAIALANDNNIWVYDQATFQLVKIAPDGAVLASSDNLSAQLPQPPIARQAIARENMVYLNDSEKGIFLFDGFAQYHQLLPLPAYEHIWMLDGHLQLFRKGELSAYNLKAMKKVRLPMPMAGKQAIQARWQGGRLYLLSEDGRLSVYERDD